MCSICIEKVFRGPPNSGNGGYVAGALANFLEGDVEVKLMLPPPLEKKLEIDVSEGKAILFDDGHEVAVAVKSDLSELDIPNPPTMEEAIAASKKSHTFKMGDGNSCYVCSCGREEGKGLRIFAGPLGRDQMVASPWKPYPDLADEKGLIKEKFIWAALDCPGAFSAYSYLKAPFLLLGTQTSHIEKKLPVDQVYIACGWHLKKEGRKHFTNTAIFSGSGEVLAMATQVWIEFKG